MFENGKLLRARGIYDKAEKMSSGNILGECVSKRTNFSSEYHRGIAQEAISSWESCMRLSGLESEKEKLKGRLI